MSKVIIHIGTHKTATTTIQNMFYDNATVLAQHNVIYPRLSKSAGHHGLVAEWIKLPEHLHLKEGSIRTLRSLSQKYASGNYTVFLSSEEFSRGSRVDFSAIRDALSDFDDIEVLCVLRDQWQFIQSCYLEISKTRPILRHPSHFFKMAIENDSADGLRTDYNAIYDQLLRAFTPEEITFFDFEDCRRAQYGIIGKILSHLGVDLKPDEFEITDRNHANRSSKPLPVWAANLVAEPKIATRRMIAATSAAFNIKFGENAPSCIWSREEYNDLNIYGKERNSKLAERVQIWQPEFIIESLTPEDGNIFRDDISSNFWLLCCRRMYMLESS